MESGAAMGSDSAAAQAALVRGLWQPPPPTSEVACAACGAQLGAAVPTGSRPPVEPTNVMAMPARGPRSRRADTRAERRFTPAGLPARRPRVIDDDEAALDAFTRSWEASSDDRPSPPTRSC